MLRDDSSGGVELQSGSRIVWGPSPAMQRVRQAVEHAAAADITVLLEGPTGSGKEVVARAIHEHSRRRNRPFIAANCGALSENLLETELFGHRRGAFTGADRERKGLFVEANGGTLLLDEIAEASERLQTRLLRVLETGEVTQVGANLPERVDVRVIAASNRDLAKLVAEGRFRSDLYHRLLVFQIQLPSLAERREDIPALVDFFLGQLAAKHGRLRPKVCPQAHFDLVYRRDYPGNVRELRNLLECALVRTLSSESIGLAQLGLGYGAGIEWQRRPLTLIEERKLFERRRVEDALRRSGGNKVRAARDLGISVRWLHKILDRDVRAARSGEKGAKR